MSEKSYYRVFWIWSFGLAIWNLFVACIEYDRFMRERTSKREMGNQAQEQNEERVRPRGSILSSWKLMAQVHHYNRWQLFLPLTNACVVLFNCIRGLIFLTFPQQKNEMNEYENSTLYYLNSCYVIDLFGSFRRGWAIHLVSSSCLQLQLITKLVSFMNLLDLAGRNQYFYRKVNATQLDFAYFYSLSSTYFGLFPWIFRNKNYHYHCDEPGMIERFHETKRSFKELKSKDKIDRIYFHNPIDFNECYQDDTIKVMEWTRGFDDTIIVTFRPFQAKPFHRYNPRTLVYLIGWLSMSSGFFFAIPMIAFLSIMQSEFGPKFGLDVLDPSTWSSASRQIWCEPGGMFLVFDCSLNCILIAINTTYIALLLVSASSCQSKTDKVYQWLAWHRRAYRQLELEYAASECESRGRDIQYSIDRFRSKQNQGEICTFNEDIDYLIDLIDVLRMEFEDFEEFFGSYINVSFLYGGLACAICVAMLFRPDSPSEVALVSCLSLAVVAPGLYALIAGAVTEYSVSIRGDLIGSDKSATRSLTDTKGFYTKFLRITKVLATLMVDPLGLIEPKVATRISKTYVHFSDLDNRAFKIMGSIPLTFGAVLSVSNEVSPSSNSSDSNGIKAFRSSAGLSPLQFYSSATFKLPLQLKAIQTHDSPIR